MTSAEYVATVVAREERDRRYWAKEKAEAAQAAEALKVALEGLREIEQLPALTNFQKMAVVYAISKLTPAEEDES